MLQFIKKLFCFALVMHRRLASQQLFFKEQNIASKQYSVPFVVRRRINESRRARILDCLPWVLTAAFLTLCLLHYFSRRPLWSDEMWVFQSVQKLSLREIFGMLVGAQVFPRVHLFCVKFISMYFNDDLLAVRFLSLAFMIGAYFVWRRIFILELGKGWLAILAIASFVASYQLSYYASELKPYSMDVLTVGVYCLFMYYQRGFKDKAPTPGLYLSVLLLPLLIFFSYAGLFVFWMVGLNFLRLLRHNQKLWPVFLMHAIAASACFAALYKIDLQYSVTVSGLYDYWKDYFLGVKSFYSFIAPFGEGLRELATWWFGHSKLFIRMATPFVPLFVYSLGRYGFGSWVKDRGGVFSLPGMGAFLFLELVVLSILRKYPFTGDRITLFLAPFVFFFIVKGIDSLKNVRIVYPLILSYYILFLSVCLVSSFIHFLSLYHG